MIQLVFQRVVKKSEKPVFIYLKGIPPMHVAALSSIYTHYKEILKSVPPDEMDNIYYTVGHHRVTGADKFPQRTASTFLWQSAIPWDIDGTDQARALEYGLVVADVLKCKPDALTVSRTGNGCHVLAYLKRPIDNKAYFTEHKAAYDEICRKIAEKLRDLGLPFEKVDPVIFEPARVLRMPGSINRKPGKEARPCETVQAASHVVDLDLYKISGLEAAAKENISPSELKKQYPTPDLNEMVAECRFIGEAVAHPERIHEPHLFDLLSLMVPQAKEKTIDGPMGPLTAKELGKYVFDRATSSASLARQDFDKKWEDSGRYGGRKCATINANWGKCKECPHFEKIVSPFQLKSKEHIGSQANGFWVLNQKGDFLHPCYADLSKIYQSETHLKVTSDERYFEFNGTHFVPTAPLIIKSWVNQKVTPNDPMRETHRLEFLAKVKSDSAIKTVDEMKLFNDGLRAKLNCKNGVVDLLTGELLPHDPKFGFRYALDYEFHPGGVSELFIEWLAKMSQENSDVMESILDMMAYILWPAYDDHIFVYLIGEGANGKSTLIHIMQALIGKINFSSVSLHQLSTNRFAASSLDGMLANLSEESSGHVFEASELDMIKTLSSGGEIQVERKNQHAFTMRNTAKLLFSANKPPIFRDQGHALKRRLVVLPFDYVITEPDAGIEERLIAECPAILSMLIARLQANIQANNGRFKVSRGGRTAEVARQKMLNSGNSVCEWAEEKLISSAEVPMDEFVKVNEAYTDYAKWCDENGFKNTLNKYVFCRVMSDSVVTGSLGKEKTRTIRLGKEVHRVYPRTRFKGVQGGEANVLN